MLHLHLGYLLLMFINTQVHFTLHIFVFTQALRLGFILNPIYFLSKSILYR
jgi:hypothetical protein